MKRFFSLILCLCFCLDCTIVFAQPIVDEFANSSLDKNLRVIYSKASPIYDDLVLNTLNPNLRVKEQKVAPIVDDFALSTLSPDLKIERSNLNKYDFENIERMVVKISPVNYGTTRRKLYEGQPIDFIVKEDIYFGDVKISKGTPVKARVETISKNEAYGVPADLIIDNFVVNNMPLEGQIKIVGANRALWVYPIGWVLMPFCFAGLLVFPIRGGHAKLRPSNTFEVYFEK